MEFIQSMVAEKLLLEILSIALECNLAQEPQNGKAGKAHQKRGVPALRYAMGRLGEERS